MMEWSNEVSLEFLKFYEKEPVIWNKKNIQHRNRNSINDAWIRIQRSLSVPCTVKDLKKKKESLMATFRSLLNKVIASKIYGNADNYKPNWFAYEVMEKFLKDIYQPRPFYRNEESQDAFIIEDVTQNEDDENDENINEDNHENDDFAAKSKPNSSQNPFPFSVDRENRKRKGFSLANLLKNVYESSEKDECALYAELLAKKLKSFDENTRDILMHEIDSIIFRTKVQQRNEW